MRKLCLQGRTFGFLQGQATVFYRRLAQRLYSLGACVQRVNMSAGDQWFWGEWCAEDFREPMDCFPHFIDKWLDQNQITDLVMFNDTRPFNAIGASLAKAKGLNVWVFEEGYLRPNWVTLELGGVNGHSQLPNDPQWIKQTAASLPDTVSSMNKNLPRSMKSRILADCRWQYENLIRRYAWKHFRTHRPWPIWLEYMGWAKKMSTVRFKRRHAEKIVTTLVAESRLFYLLPLQLESDSQIRIHSSFSDNEDVLSTVIESFACHADVRSLLVVKNHPLDNGLINYRALTKNIAASYGVEDRVSFIDGGDLQALLNHTQGVVTVNSTVGTSALKAGKALKCLGKAIYDIDGLTYQGDLNTFWGATFLPDPELLEDFFKVLCHHCLLNGDFYTAQGMGRVIYHAVRRFVSVDGAISNVG